VSNREVAIFHPTDLGAKLGLNLVSRGLATPQPPDHLRLRVEAAVWRNKTRNLVEREDGNPLTDVEMDTHAEERVLSKLCHGVLTSRLIHHERGAGYHAFEVRLENAISNPLAHSEVIGVNDQLFA
jgi:hypothetical protein